MYSRRQEDPTPHIQQGHRHVEVWNNGAPPSNTPISRGLCAFEGLFMDNVLVLERTRRGCVVERSRHEEEIDLFEGAAAGLRAAEINKGDRKEVEN